MRSWWEVSSFFKPNFDNVTTFCGCFYNFVSYRFKWHINERGCWLIEICFNSSKTEIHHRTIAHNAEHDPNKTNESGFWWEYFIDAASARFLRKFFQKFLIFSWLGFHRFFFWNHCALRHALASKCLHFGSPAMMGRGSRQWKEVENNGKGVQGNSIPDTWEGVIIRNYREQLEIIFLLRPTPSFLFFFIFSF